ncbi:phage head closure protein [Orenia marismortui]|uniref:phage head closure protein n=1 Tax=Orenia marismortui TaxID=46469 RepID=UPI000365FC38|nr:phage head closure protein [Orenia marismortui]
MIKSKKEVMKDLATKPRRKIIIQKKTITTDEWENQVEDWVDWRIIWGQRLELFGSEYYAAAQIGEEKTIKFKIRYVTFLEEVDTVKFRIIYKDKEIFDIKDTDSLNDDGMWFIIKAEKSGELNGSNS